MRSLCARHAAQRRGGREPDHVDAGAHLDVVEVKEGGELGAEPDGEQRLRADNHVECGELEAQRPRLGARRAVHGEKLARRGERAVAEERPNRRSERRPVAPQHCGGRSRGGGGGGRADPAQQVEEAERASVGEQALRERVEEAAVVREHAGAGGVVCGVARRRPQEWHAAGQRQGDGGRDELPLQQRRHHPHELVEHARGLRRVVDARLEPTDRHGRKRAGGVEQIAAARRARLAARVAEPLPQEHRPVVRLEASRDLGRDPQVGEAEADRSVAQQVGELALRLPHRERGGAGHLAHVQADAQRVSAPAPRLPRCLACARAGQPVRPVE
mmetsp:Transcript_15343/g.49024  ORF Transcript_15343/g.49024 Transcript_15343/m.49024 type:complete len:330 (+) Transcript_15343:1561-2550(+)